MLRLRGLETSRVLLLEHNSSRLSFEIQWITSRFPQTVRPPHAAAAAVGFGVPFFFAKRPIMMAIAAAIYAGSQTACLSRLSSPSTSSMPFILVSQATASVPAAPPSRPRESWHPHQVRGAEAARAMDALTEAARHHSGQPRHP